MVYLRSYNYKRAVEHGMKRGIVGQLIMLRSNPYTHSEIQFSDGRSFSATMQNNAKCARFMDIDYNKHPERWDAVAIPMSDSKEKFIRHQAELMSGNIKYDLWGLLSFGTSWRIVKPDPDKMWCSEICTVLIQLAHKKIPLAPDRTHPTLLHETCQQYFCPEKLCTR